MRVKIAEFEKKMLSHIFGLFLSRYADMEKVDAYLNEAIPYIELLIESAGEGKWLMGTDDLTLLDVHAAAMMDFLFVMIKAEANSEAATRLNVAQNAPKWCAYMERIRAHPKIAPVCMNVTAADQYATRARTWEEGVKC